MGDVLKLIIVFYDMAKRYARELIAGGVAHYVYSDDGQGNVTISVEEG